MSFHHNPLQVEIKRRRTLLIISVKSDAIKQPLN